MLGHTRLKIMRRAMRDDDHQVRRLSARWVLNSFACSYFVKPLPIFERSVRGYLSLV